MARPQKTPALPAHTELDEARIDGAVVAMRQDATALAEANAQRETTVRAVAQQLGYQLPADCTDPDLIQRDISANMRRSVEACLEVGRGLAVLKAACEHGHFVNRLESLGIEPRVAQKFMASAVRFSKATTSSLLKAAGSESKLFEMLVMDDDQIDELVQTGQTGELHLDDVATMSVRELRAALREAKADADAQAKVRSDLHAKLDKAQLKAKRIAKETPDQRLAELHKEAALAGFEAQAAITGTLRPALQALAEMEEAHGSQTVVMAGLVGQVQAALNALRDEYDLPDVSNAADQALAAETAAWAGK